MAAAPPPGAKPAPPKPTPTWGQVPGQALNNFLPDLGETIRGVGSAVTHPGETWDALSGVVQGVGSQVAGKMGFQKDPAQAKNEALARTVEAPYKATYAPLLQHGFTDEGTAGLRTALAQHPFGTGTDIASAFTLGGGGLGAAAKGAEAAGMARTASVLGKAGKVAGAVGSAIDPTENILRVAKGVAKVPGTVIRGVNSAATGVPMNYYELAAKAGNNPFSKNGRAFLGANLGMTTPTQTAMDMRSALSATQSAGKDAHEASLAAAAAKGVQPSYQPILDKIAEQEAELAKYPPGQMTEARDALAQAKQDVLDHQKEFLAGNPDYQGPLAIDRLKKGLWNQRMAERNPAAQNVLGGLYNDGIKKSLSDAVPGYQDLMDVSQENMDRVNDIGKTLGLGKKAASSGVIRKGLKQATSARGRSLLDDLSSKDSTIPYQLAGHATNEWGAHSLLDTILAAPAAAALGTPVGALAPFIATSPKITALGHFAAGAAGSAGRQAARAARWGSYPAQALSATAPADGSPAPEPGDAPPAPQGAPPTAEDAAWRAMVHQESGGHQTDAQGRPLTSSKGATGIAQVMPRTGPEAAAYAGEPWDPDRFAHDAAYNEKIGRAYFHHLVQANGGDVAKAVAAYNAGPDKLARAVAQGGDWLKNLPAETRKYAANVAARSSHARGGTVGYEHLVNRLMTRAKNAKREADKITEPLMKAPDEAIARALDISQEAI